MDFVIQTQNKWKHMYAPVYFNSATKTVTNSDKYDLDKSSQEILYRINNWINEGSGWIIESIEAQYVNISIYSPLIGSTYIELPDGLKNPMKALINIFGVILDI